MSLYIQQLKKEAQADRDRAAAKTKAAEVVEVEAARRRLVSCAGS